MNKKLGGMMETEKGEPFPATEKTEKVVFLHQIPLPPESVS